MYILEVSLYHRAALVCVIHTCRLGRAFRPFMLIGNMQRDDMYGCSDECRTAATHFTPHSPYAAVLWPNMSASRHPGSLSVSRRARLLKSEWTFTIYIAIFYAESVRTSQIKFNVAYRDCIFFRLYFERLSLCGFWRVQPYLRFNRRTTKDIIHILSIVWLCLK